VALRAAALMRPMAASALNSSAASWTPPG
jgi:hypothetical protein